MPAVKKAQAGYDAAHDAYDPWSAEARAKAAAEIPAHPSSAGVTTGSDGIADGLDAVMNCNGSSTLTLTETKAPAGHTGLSEPIVLQGDGDGWTVKSAPNGVTVDRSKPAKVIPVGVWGTVSTLTVTVPNKPIEKTAPPVKHEKPAPPAVHEATPPVPTKVVAGGGGACSPSAEWAGFGLVAVGLAGAGVAARRRFARR